MIRVIPVQFATSNDVFSLFSFNIYQSFVYITACILSMKVAFFVHTGIVKMEDGYPV